MRQVRNLLSISAIILYSCLSFAGAPNYTTFQTKILAPSGLPLENPAVNFRFTILDSFGTCVLYIEDYVAVNMTGSSGVVSFSLGSGTKSYPGTATLMNEVFNNSVTVPHACQAGGTYAPGATDRRQIVMQFNDGGGWQTLPQMAINSVFYSNYATTAEKLGNYVSADYLRPATLPTCIVGQALHYNGTSFTCVTASAASGVTSVNVNSPLSIVNTTSTPVISLAQASAAASGYLSSTDWTAFNSKASATLPAGNLYVGNGSNAAAGVTLSGDATLNSSGDLSLKNSGVAAGAYGSAAAVPVLAVDAKGRVTSASSTPYQNATAGAKGVVQVGSNISVSAGVISLTSNDVTNALGYTPPNANQAFTQNGNSFGAAANLGTADSNNLNFMTSGTPKITVQPGGNVGIGTTTPNYKLDVAGDLNVSGNFKVNGVNIAAGGGTVTNVSGSGAISVVNTSTTPVVAIAIANATTTGALSSSDWSNFNNKMNNLSSDITTALGYTPLNKILSPNFIFVGSAGSIATGVAMSGDASILSNGQVTLTNSNATRTNLGLGTSATFNVPAAGDAASTEVVRGNDSRLTDGRAPIGTASGDLTGTYPSPTLKITGVGVGTYTKVTVDAKGRVTSATQFTSGDVTTAMGYTPGPASQWITNSSDISYSAGKVGIGTTTPAYALQVSGDISVSGNFKVNGVNIAANGGTVTNVSGSSPISVLNTANTPVISIATANGTTSGALSSADWSVFNNKMNNGSSDITTALGYAPLNRLLNNGLIFVGNVGNIATGVAMSGDASIIASGNITLTNSATTRGNLGLGTSATFNVPVAGDASSTEVVRGTDSRLTDGRAPIGVASGDLTGSYPNPTLKTTGVGNGTYTKVTVDTKGRVISATNIGSTDITTAGAIINNGNLFSADAAIGTNDNFNLLFKTNNATKMTILSGGNVGIGTTTPSNRFTVPWISGDTVATANFGSSNSSNNQDAIVANSYNGYAIRATSLNGYAGRFEGGAVGINQGTGTGIVALNVGTGLAFESYADAGTSGIFQAGLASNTSPTLVTKQNGAGTADLFQAQNSSGTSLFKINSSGSVGIGTTGPRSALDVRNGSISGKPSVSNVGTTIDFSTGNTQYTASNCGSFQLNNLKDGASYTFIVKGGTPATCTFTGFSDAGSTPLTVHMPPDNGATITGKHTIFNLIIGGSDVYVAWTPGY